jgi:hypothetical protein
MKLRFTHHAAATHTRRSVQLESSGFAAEAWIEIANRRLPQPVAWDGLVLPLLHFLMERGEDVEVDGPVTRDCARNLEALQEYWSFACPGAFRKVSFAFRELATPDPPAQPAFLVAFSSGSDSLFTYLRHREALQPREAHHHREALHTRKATDRASHYPIAGGVFVQGFDVPLTEDAAYLTLASKAESFLKLRGDDLFLVRTNLRRDFCRDWEAAHGLMLAGCLLQFQNSYAGALLGSSYRFDRLLLHWGSSPLVDHLAGNAAFPLVHDGAAFSRSEKLAFLSRFKDALDVMKVCYAGSRVDQNCGVCAKCFRTRVILLRHGVDSCGAFPQPLAPSEIEAHAISGPKELETLKWELDDARRHGLSAAWVHSLARLVGRAERRGSRVALMGKIVGPAGMAALRKLRDKLA